MCGNTVANFYSYFDLVQHKYNKMDVRDPAVSPHGNHYLPHRPPANVEPTGSNPIPDPQRAEFETHLLASANRAVLSSIKRSEMREVLRSPGIQYPATVWTDQRERARKINQKIWTLKQYDLLESQVYRRSETVTETEYAQPNCACVWDAFDLITGVHRGLHHAGKLAFPASIFTEVSVGINKTHERCSEQYTGITQADVEYALKGCTVCNSKAANHEPPTITPIISHQCLDRVYMDLVDFRSQPDGDMKWVLRIRDHFSRYIWLFGIKVKSSSEVAQCLKTWLAWCGHSKNFYSDNGKEFDGAVADLVIQTCWSFR
jgi:hypothetical protein